MTRKTYARREGDQKSCPGCGAAMLRPLHWSPSRWATSKFCSLQCAGLSQPRADAKEKLASLIKRDPKTQCWLWQGTIGDHGYGQIVVDGQIWRAHRLSYTLHHGEIPEGALVRHTCDVPACVNPEHLCLGTSKDNTGDAISRNRLACGERHGRAKLTEESVRDIRSSQLTSTEAARKYGVSRKAAANALSGKTWGTIQ